MAFSMALSVRISLVVIPFSSSAIAARVEARATSYQTASPEGESAEWGRARPSPSATTCEVPAVPRELAAAAGRGTRLAAEPGGFLQRQPRQRRNVRRSSATLARIVALRRRQRRAAGDDDGGAVVHGRKRHHQARKALVAGRHADDGGAVRQGAEEAAENDGGIVCGRAGCRTCPRCPACGRRTDRRRRRRRGAGRIRRQPWRPRPSGPRSRSVRCASPARVACRPAVGYLPWSRSA